MALFSIVEPQHTEPSYTQRLGTLDSVTCVTVTSWFAGLDARAVRGRRTGAEGEGNFGQLMCTQWSWLIPIPLSTYLLACLQGQPYCAAGVVDLLALFRCISCRYCFSTDISKPELLGAPGRVFTSRQVSSKSCSCQPQHALMCSFPAQHRPHIHWGILFLLLQPEMTRNVQQQSKDVYLRAQEALHCRVHSTLVLPLYRQVPMHVLMQP